MAGSDLIPSLAMVLVQFLYAGLNITSKLALESGMNPLVLVAYRQLFATVAVAPCAYFIERKKRPKITKAILFQILLCSITGATANQVFYFEGLKYSTPTAACALTNILPAATFILAVLFRQESVGIKTRAGGAKVAGTVVCVGGAMLLSFYHGHTIGFADSKIHWKYAERMSHRSPGGQGGGMVLGSLCLIISSVAWAAWFVIQANVNEKFPAPYTSTALMSLMATVQCAAIGVAVEHSSFAAWSLFKFKIRLVSALYAGVICSGIAFCVTSWSIQKKGPLYASVFSPLLLVIVAVFSWAFFQEKIFVGTLIGSLLIVGGLYGVLWGKTKEVKLQQQMAAAAKLDECGEKDDLEGEPSRVS